MLTNRKYLLVQKHFNEFLYFACKCKFTNCLSFKIYHTGRLVIMTCLYRHLPTHSANKLELNTYEKIKQCNFQFCDSNLKQSVTNTS